MEAARTGPAGEAAEIASAPGSGERSSARAAPPSVLRRMGPAFGEDFTDVDLEVDADTEAGAAHAAAFTDGQRIGFASGRYAPGTTVGDRLLAHELAHVVQGRIGTANDPSVGVAQLEAEADRAAEAVLSGAAPEFGVPVRSASATVQRVLRGDEDETPEDDLVPVVFATRAEAREVLAARVRTPAGDPGRFAIGWVTTSRLELEIDGRIVARARLTEDGNRMPAGVVSSGSSGTASWWHHRSGEPVTGAWERRVIPVTDGEPIYLMIFVQDDVAAFRAALGSRALIAVRLGGGTGTGTPADAGEGGEPGTVPGWASTRFEALRARLRREQRRLATVARDTVGDTAPATLNRLYRLEGIPKRLALGLAGEAPAVQVTVESGTPSAPGRAAPEASASVTLIEADSVGQSWERVLTVARSLYLGRRGGATTAEAAVAPMGVPGTDAADPDAVASNEAAYPAEIVYHGPPTAVTGASHAFTMQLDYSELGRFAVFGHFALRRYSWDIYRIRNVAGTATDEAGRAVGRGEGALGVLESGFGDIGEDIASSSWTELLAQRDLIGIDAGLRSIGTLVRSYVSLVTQPLDERTIRFDQEGTYVIVCTSAEAPVYRTERNPNPVVRAPSVALYALPVRSARRLATELVAPAEVDAIDAEIARLEAEARTAPEAELPALREQIDGLRERRGEARAADQSDLPTHITTSATELHQQIELLEKLIGGEHPDAPDVRLLRVQLELSHTTAERALANARAGLDQLVVQERALAEVTDLQGTVHRPHAAFVSDTDGRALPLTLALAERSDSTTSRQRWVLVDLSTPGHRDRYEGSSRTEGAAGKAAAIQAAFAAFAGATPYGRGWIGVRLPDELTTEIGTSAVDARLRAHPDASGRFLQRLESLATAASIAALVVTGPAAVALGVVGGLAGGAVAAHRLHRRHAGGYLEPDLQTAMDVAAIVGAVAGVAGGAAGLVPRGSRFFGAAGVTIRGVEIYGYLQLGGSMLVIPVSYVRELERIQADPNLSEGERAARKAEAFLSAFRSSVELAVSAAQMIGHHPGGGAGGPERPPASEGPGVPRTPREPVPARPAEEGAPVRPAEEGAPVRPVEEPAPTRPEPEAADAENLRTVGDPRTGAVTLVPGSGTRSARVAAEVFQRTATATPEAEVGLFRNTETGEYVVAIGDGESVRLAHDDPNWTDLLPEGSRSAGRWVLEQHSHPADPVTGHTRQADYWPSGADGDFLGVVTEALTPPPHKATGRITLHTPGGTRTTTYSYDPSAARPYSVEVPVPGRPAPYRRSYRTLEDFYADRATHTGTPAPEVPATFPGATRARPEGAATEPGATTGRGEPPPPARAPSSETPLPQSRAQRLRELEAELTAAQEGGDTTRTATAQRRLLEAQAEITAGLGDTGLTAGQLAKLLDVGLTPEQVRAVRAWLGEGTGAYVSRRDVTGADLEMLARVAESLRPYLDDPAVAEALQALASPRPGATQGWGPKAVARRLDGVPRDQLPRFLELITDPTLPYANLSMDSLTPLKEPAVLRLISAFPEVMVRIQRPGDRSRGLAVLRRLAERFAADPVTGADYVRAVHDAGDIRAMEAAVGLESPPRRVPVRGAQRVEPDPGHAAWGDHMRQADAYLTDHPAYLEQATAPRPDGTVMSRAEVQALLAAMYLIRARARFGEFAHLTHEQRLQMLDDFIATGRRIRMTGDHQGPLNNLSGALAESLFLPVGPGHQVVLPNPSGGATRVDFELPDADRVIPDRRNFVELKSHEVPSVGTARTHVRDAIADAPAVAQAGGVHLIEYVRAPSPEVQGRMLDVLFGPDSPLQAARFGGGDWIPRSQWVPAAGGGTGSQ